MVDGITRKIVILKNIDSNIIEEAILVLRTAPEGKNSNESQKKGHLQDKREGDYLMREAEAVVNNFIEERKKDRRALLNCQSDKKSFFKSQLFINIIINMGLVASVALLVYIVTNML